MSKLISGKEALIALANGEEVEVKRIHDSDWQYGKCFGVSVFTDSEDTKFRIKPRTIKIGNYEVPAPFEPKVGDTVYFIDNESLSGFERNTYGISGEEQWVQFGAWRNESEIKQVVAALRSVFKGHNNE